MTIHVPRLQGSGSVRAAATAYPSVGMAPATPRAVLLGNRLQSLSALRQILSGHA
jgi:hypothetical protein